MPKLQDFPIEKIIRSRRKTFSIQVTDNATIILKIPYWVSNGQLIELLEKHQNWIKQRLNQAKLKKQIVNHQFQPDERFWFLGKSYQLRFSNTQTEPVQLKDKFLTLRSDLQNNARQALLKWYKEQAKRIFTQRAQIYATLMGLQYNQLKLSSARKRWGSCSTKRNINIVWRLIMAPLHIIDYVIIHELAHLRYMNHSKAFWQLVSKFYPNYKNAQNWLKQYGPYLDF